MASLIGQKLGQYEVVELLGQGGMATVYKGYQSSIGRHVAIKVLPPHPGLDDQFIKRFELEAKTIGSLQHPHILPLYDYGAEGDVLYLAMAYIDGGSLEDLMDSGAMATQRVVKFLSEVASAMDYAHRQGVVHRDIKPANILIDSEGHALLADFGIVKMIEGEANLTGTGVVGTPAYMAPEQGQGIATVDGRADVYALGIIIYEMLTGKQPYQADTLMQVLFKHINDPIPNILEENPDLPEDVQYVIDKVLAKDPDERYQTAADFAEDLGESLQGNGTLSSTRVRQTPPQASTAVLTSSDTQAPASQTVIMQQNTNPLVLLAGFGLIALVIVIVAILLISQQGQQPEPATQIAAVDEVTATLSPTPAAQNFGELRYNTIDAPGDTVNLRLTGLQPAGDGLRYFAWLVSSENRNAVLLGELGLDAFGDSILSFTDPEGRPLPIWANGVIITRQSEATVAPTGDIAYSGGIPAAIPNSLRSIFFEDEDGFDGGSLLIGTVTEAQTASQHAGLAAGARNLGSMKTHAEHTLNILNGTMEDHDASGRASNPGRGVGVYFFIDKIEEQLSAATNAPGASLSLQINAELIFVCTQNVRDWADQMVALELELIAAEDIESVATQAAQSEQLATAILQGIDANENGIVEPFEGECGLAQIPDFGIQVANLEIFEGSVTDFATDS